MTERPTPLSPEVLAHHVERHACNADIAIARCPCGDTDAFICVVCGRVLFISARSWCEHAEKLWSPFA